MAAKIVLIFADMNHGFYLFWCIMRFAMAMVLVLIASTTQAAPIVVTFDDLVGSGTLADGYGGINWLNNWRYYELAQDPYNFASPLQRIYNMDANGVRMQDAAFEFASPMVFDGAFVSGFDYVDVSFKLYLNGNLVHTSGIIEPTSVATFLSSGYGGLVDRVEVNSVGGDIPNYYVLDNITYSAAAVPEPASLALWSLIGMAGLATWRRKKRIVAMN